MKFGYVLIAVVVALVAGFAVGALTSDDESDDRPAATRSDGRTITTGSGDAPDRAAQTTGEETTTPGTDTGDGTERAPESANDPRPAAPDDVIGERPGGGGDEDDGR